MEVDQENASSLHSADILFVCGWEIERASAQELENVQHAFLNEGKGLVLFQQGQTHEALGPLLGISPLPINQNAALTAFPPVAEGSFGDPNSKGLAGVGYWVLNITSIPLGYTVVAKSPTDDPIALYYPPNTFAPHAGPLFVHGDFNILGQGPYPPHR